MLDLLIFGKKTAPDFFWDARSGVLPVGATFTRASAGWYFNSAGVLVQAANNAPRYDYDPATLTLLGYLSEMQSTNVLLNSGDLGNASWNKTNNTVTSNVATAPDGTVSAAHVVESAASGPHDIVKQFTVTAGATSNLSVFLKAGARSKFFIAYGGVVANEFATAVFDLIAGTVSQTGTGAAGGTITSTTIRAIGGGWYRVGLIASLPTTTVPFFQLGATPAATGNVFTTAGEVSYAGDGTSDYYAWGAQGEVGNTGITSLIPTAGSVVTRAADILTLPLTSLPGWNATRGGVLAVAYQLYTVRSGAQTAAALVDGGTFANAVLLYENFGGSARATTVVANNTVQLSGAAAPLPFVRRKTAMGWSVGRQQIAHDGGLDNTNGGQPSTLPTGLINLRIGTDDGTSGLNGAVESLTYYAGARSDAFVQQVSR